MATYKVPQDVEAEDKLIGPFSFRQFIYLIIAALGITIGIGLWQLFPGLIVIPLPIVLFFLVLALPLRKDQPMETYLAAVVRFFLKPRMRMWQPEGSIGLVTIVSAPVGNLQLTKQVGGAAAAQQLDYLAQVIDTQGWSTRGVVNPTISMDDTAYAEAQAAEDILADTANVARNFDTMITQSNAARRENAVRQVQQAIQQTPAVDSASSSTSPKGPVDERSAPALPATPPAAQAPASTSASQDNDVTPKIDYNPYPASMHQHVLDPRRAHETPTPLVPRPLPAPQNTPAKSDSTSSEPVSPDIMRLASNNDLSISALAHEAHRLQERDEDGEEVVISLR